MYSVDTRAMKSRPIDLQTARLRDRLAGRAWSRAGAIAAVVNRGVPRRVLALSTRLGLLLSGSVIIACSVALTIWNDLGPGPLDVFIGGLQTRSGIPMTIAVWATVGALLVTAWLLGKRPGVGSVLSPLVVGPVLQVAIAGLDSIDAPTSIVARLLVHLAAIAGIGLGAGALIVSGLGAGSGELLASAASDRVGPTEPKMRTVCEAMWIVLGVALGGPIGPGTVLVAVFIGPAVTIGFRTVDGLAARSISTVSTALAVDRVERLLV